MADEGDSKSLVLITRVGSTPTTGTNAKGPGLKSRGPFAVRRTEILSAQRCCKSKTRNRSSGFSLQVGRVALADFCCAPRRALAKTRARPLLCFGCFCRRQRLSCAAVQPRTGRLCDAV